jgi:hypothetical protein
VLGAAVVALVGACGTGDPPAASIPASVTSGSPTATNGDLAFDVTAPSPHDGAVLTVPGRCFAPDSTATVTLANTSGTALFFTGDALLFDRYPSRETGRWLNMRSADLSDPQPPGVVEWPLVGLVELPAAASTALTLIAPPDLGSWTSVMRIADDVGGVGATEIAFAFEVAADCT